jgi:hypothetical protein
MASYLENLMKEAKEYNKARNKTSEYSYKGSSYPPNDIAQGAKGREYYKALASNSRQNQDAQMGQMLGALLQGRRYDDATGKQIKAKPKNTSKRQGFKIP